METSATQCKKDRYLDKWQVMEYDMYCRNDGDKWQVAAGNERRKMTAAHGNKHHSMENDR